MSSNNVLCFSYLRELCNIIRSADRIIYMCMDYIAPLTYYILQSANTNLALLDL